MATVLVAFSISDEALANTVLYPNMSAEQIVEERLEKANLLMYNDSTDFARGTADPINTYAVIPLDKLLDDAL
jgi:hypothetical protein